ncbi:MAG: T9SS type A sorting domain-containing protein [Candidatus Latescibacteria bacterium]|nr:T9SS type A sorting domain-containing protein [Candidatus Latescibacterota bacterium]
MECDLQAPGARGPGGLHCPALCLLSRGNSPPAWGSILLRGADTWQSHEPVGQCAGGPEPEGVADSGGSPGRVRPFCTPSDDHLFGEDVELAVYNLAGQRVVRLAEGVREAGSYTVRWDGRDEQGHELASGVYLYRLRAGERVQTRKLLSLR